MSDRIDLDEIERAAKRASKGEWSVVRPTTVLALIARVRELETKNERLLKHVAINDEEYATTKDVLRAEHRACTELRAALKDALRQDLSMERIAVLRKLCEP